jgi:hypothetical protein
MTNGPEQAAAAPEAAEDVAGHLPLDDQGHQGEHGGEPQPGAGGLGLDQEADGRHAEDAEQGGPAEPPDLPRTSAPGSGRCTAGAG